jgi:alpha-amylase
MKTRQVRPWSVIAALALLLASCAGTRVDVAPQASATVSPRVSQWDHEWARGAVFYEVFVRSFADSNGDGIGDFQGLTAKLDYLRDLGVDGLWLMPVFKSPSYHGYDTTDYEAINPQYGTEADFDRFLAEAHRRGIKVIVDFVMNHSSSQHPWFIDSASSPTSRHRDWYLWRADDPGWTPPWGGDNHTWHEKNGAFYYGVFWGGMPDLNFATPAVRREMERLASFWLRRGVDGFRLDATRHLFANGDGPLQSDQPETHGYLKEFAAHVRGVAPQSILVGENWTDTPVIAQYYGSTAEVKGGDELPLSFDFPLAEKILEGARDGDASGIGAKLQEIAALYPPGVIDAPFLTNHDNIRIGTLLAGNPAGLRSAAAVLLTLPGTPFLYYGEEIGLQNGPGDKDELKRTPMPWDASAGGGFTTGEPWFDFAPGKETANVKAELADPGSLLSWYRQLLRVRRASAALQKGGLTLLSSADRATPVLAFVRESEGRDGERVLVVHNLSGSEVEAGPYGVPGERAEMLLMSAGGAGGAVPARAPEGWKVRLPAGASGVWRIR